MFDILLSTKQHFHILKRKNNNTKLKTKDKQSALHLAV